MSRTRIAALALLLMTMGVIRPVEAQTQPADTAAAGVRQVVERFGRALATGDSVGALDLLHADVVIYEGGHAETKEQYRSGHVRSDIAYAAAVQRTTVSSQVLISGDMAVYTSTSKSTGRYRNRDVNSEGTETIVLVRGRDGWRIRHIHWS